MGLFEAVLSFSVLLLTLAAASFLLSRKKHLFSLLLSVISSISAGFFCHFWKLALQDGGKSTVLLGYDRYPFVLYCIIGAFLFNAIILFYSMIGLSKKELSRKTRVILRLAVILLLIAFIVTVAYLTMRNTIIGTWTGDGSFAVPNLQFPLEHATILQFRIDKTGTMTSLSVDGTTLIEEFSYSLWNDTITVTKDGVSYGILYTVKGNQLFFGRGGSFGIYQKTK